jgi:hypothetical protein
MSTRWVRVGIVVLLIGAVLISGIALGAGPPFTDDDTSIFEPDINWLFNAGVTTGCGGTNYCPNDPVTRGQMAAFMHRFAQFLGMENGPTDLTAAYSTWDDGPIGLPNTDPFLTLNIPTAGSYVVMAKLWLANTSALPVLMQCRLTAGAQWDEVRMGLEPSGPGAAEQAGSFTVVNTYTAPGVAALWCNDFGVNDVEVNDAKITAIRVGTLSNVHG